MAIPQTLAAILAQVENPASFAFTGLLSPRDDCVGDTHAARWDPETTSHRITRMDQPDVSLFEVIHRDGSDLITLQSGHDSCPEVEAMVRLLGPSSNKTRGRTSMSYETLHERIASIDLAHRLWRRVRFLGSEDAQALEITASLLEIARVYGHARNASFEADNDSRVPEARRQQLALAAEAAEKSVREQSARWQASECRYRSGVLISTEPDPRGGSLRLTFKRTFLSTVFVGVANYNWPVDTEPAPEGAVRRQKSGSGGKPAAPPVASLRKKAVPDDVQAVLRDAVVEGTELKLSKQLDPKLYQRVMAFLKEIGGKWNRSKQVHVFDRQVADIIELASSGEKVQTDRSFEFFPTPVELVEKMLARVELQPGELVLEPQAGLAGIAAHAAKAVGQDHVHCIELNPRHAEWLREQGYKVQEADFLSVTPTPIYDVVLMNPPFAAMADARHVLHALRFLKPNGRLSGVTSTHWAHASTREALAFREHLESLNARVEDIPAGMFKAAGTNVPTKLITIQVTTETSAKPAVIEVARAVAPAQEALDLFAEFAA